MEVLSEHNCQGWLEGYLLTGRHGLFATYEAFAMVSASMAIQHAKWLRGRARADVARAGRLAQRPAHLDLLAQRPQRLQPPGPGPDRHDDLAARRGRARLPAARRQLPARGRRPLPAQPRLRQPRSSSTSSRSCSTSSFEDAREHAARGRLALGVGRHRRRARSPTSILGCVGDVPTQETLAAAGLLREHVPELRLRVVNVVDLMALAPAGRPPARAGRASASTSCSADDDEVVCAFHGYARALHQLLHGRPPPGPLPRPRLSASRERRRRRSTWSCSTG